MIDYENIRIKICTGLSEYLGCPVIRSNQDASPPNYPYLSYTITQPMGKNNGTYGVYDDNVERKPFIQTWSISVLSDNDSECVTLAIKAREWFDRVGNLFFSESDIIIHTVGGITSRDNFLTTGYEYKKGFDVDVYLFDEIENQAEKEGYIEKAEINQKQIKQST